VKLIGERLHPALHQPGMPSGCHVSGFYSYSQCRFETYLAKGHPDVLRVVEAATRDVGAWSACDDDDAQAVRWLAGRIAESGLDYSGVMPREAYLLDALMPLLFTRDGLAEQLEVVPESPDGLHPSEIDVLLRQSGVRPALLPILLGGRRFGSSEPSDCDYCLLTAPECVQMLSEVDRAISECDPCSEAVDIESIRECLITPLRSSTNKGRRLFGSLG
jgi:hypothetical protein